MEKQSIPDSTPALDGEENKDDDEDKKEEEPKFVQNDYLEKAEMLPPKDP